MASVRKRSWTTATGETRTAWIVDYGTPRERKHFSTKKAADAFRITVEGQLQAGTYRADASKVTLQAVCDAFLAHCQGRYDRDERMTRKWLTVYRGHISKHIVPELGQWRLSQLTARGVGEFRDRLRQALSVPTTRKVLVCTAFLSTPSARIGLRPMQPAGSGLSVQERRDHAGSCPHRRTRYERSLIRPTPSFG
jgi:hypothetical protein